LTVSAARTADGRLGLVYVPRGSQALLALGAAGVRPEIVRFDPARGERSPIANAAGAGACRPALPAEQDWLLLLEGLPPLTD
ncbi:MAG TPA: hypothetical protein VFU81_22470, partial [Thermomicrobiales bacterium]|nr:hypothetical protein [Thermomicrobiales bacterium]